MNDVIRFTLKLHEGADTNEKLTVLTPMEVIFDDARNVVPEAYWDIASNLQPGESIEFTLRKVPKPEENVRRFKVLDGSGALIDYTGYTLDYACPGSVPGTVVLLQPNGRGTLSIGEDKLEEVVG